MTTDPFFKKNRPVHPLLTFLGYTPAFRPPAAQGISSPGWAKSVKERLRSKKKGEKNRDCDLKPTPSVRRQKEGASGDMLLKGAVALGCMTLVLGLLIQKTTLHVNVCHSLPERLFLGIKRPSSVSMGDVVSFHNAWSQKVLIKQIAGVAGDRLVVVQNHLWIHHANNTQTFIGPMRLCTKYALALTPMTPQVIPEGLVFVRGTHDDSIDSRYQEVGLIPLSQIQTRAIPLW